MNFAPLLGAVRGGVGGYSHHVERWNPAVFHRPDTAYYLLLYTIGVCNYL